MLPLTTRSQPTLELEPSAIVGKYRVERVLARTQASVTYLVSHLLLGYKAVLKVPHSAEDSAREARALSSVQSPHLPCLLETGTYNDAAGAHAFLVEEYVGGQNLTRWMASCRRLDALRATRITLKVASALAALHRAGLVHGDVKPDNIVVESMLETERVTLVDLGASRSTLQEETSAERPRTMATAAYMAPELPTGPATPRSDVYALALVMYDALSGGNVARSARGFSIPSLARVVPMSERLSAVLQRALAVDEAVRFVDAAAFAHALSELDATELAGYPGSSDSLSPLHQESLDTVDVSVGAGDTARPQLDQGWLEAGFVPQLWSTERPCIWVLGEDVATEQVSVRGAMLALRAQYDVRFMNAEACDKARLELLAGGVAPWVLVFGRSHVARRDPLLLVSVEQGETMHVLVSGSAEFEEQILAAEVVNLDGIVSPAVGSEMIAAELAFVGARAAGVRRCYDSLRLALGDAREDLEGLRRSLRPTSTSASSFQKVG